MHGRERERRHSVDVPTGRQPDGDRRDIQVILIESGDDVTTVKSTFVIYITGHRVR